MSFSWRPPQAYQCASSAGNHGFNKLNKRCRRRWPGRSQTKAGEEADFWSRSSFASSRDPFRLASCFELDSRGKGARLRS